MTSDNQPAPLTIGTVTASINTAEYMMRTVTLPLSLQMNTGVRAHRFMKREPTHVTYYHGF